MNNRHELLAGTIHDVSASMRDGGGLARIVSGIVRLALPDCPPDVVRNALRYSDAVRVASTLGTAFGVVETPTELSRNITRQIVEAEREADARCEDFMQSMRDHEFFATVKLPPADCDPVTGQEYGTGA